MIVGFAGSGNMAAAMARGWAAVEGGPDSMLFTDSGSGRAAKLADEVGGERVDSLEEMAERSDLIVLAVKPKALDEVAPAIAVGKPVISVLGATPLERLQAVLGDAPALVAIPNLAVEVNRGVISHTPVAAGDETFARMLELLRLLGMTVPVEEEIMDPATALMGCAGAYLARACEALIEAGVEAGLDEELSQRLVREMAAGTGEHLLTLPPAEMHVAIASPGGSTEAGLEALDEHEMYEAFKAAVHASLERMAGTR